MTNDKTKTFLSLLMIIPLASAGMGIGNTQMAFATLIGDEVSVTLENYDDSLDPGLQNATQTDTVVSGLDSFSWTDVACAADETITIDIEESTIMINSTNDLPYDYCFQNIHGEDLASPLTFTFEGLDWVGEQGSVKNVIVTDDGGLTTSAVVIDGHTIQITIFASTVMGGFQTEYAIEKAPGESGGAPGHQKQMICHVDSEDETSEVKSVPPPSLQAHLDHGDALIADMTDLVSEPPKVTEADCEANILFS